MADPAGAERAGAPVVVALGGNALLRRGDATDVATQRANARAAARVVAELARTRPVVVTHGNGPQVGLLALQAEAVAESAATPLDVLGAESEGLIGYLLELELRRWLPGREMVTVLTQVEVDARDPAFEHPTKPIGPIHPASAADRLRSERGWDVAEIEGVGVRRVVPSPEPRRIVQLPSLARLVEAGVLVICGGGGGIPVATGEEGALEGVEAVVDKDLASALLAVQLDAAGLLLLTDQPAVYTDWPRAERPIARIAVGELGAQTFEAGTMGPKVEAACRFAESTGRAAGIGALEDAAGVLAGRSGTIVIGDRVSPSGAVRDLSTDPATRLCIERKGDGR